ncbi:HalOD1 output domain-containing protein [Natrarchaeobius sp. A-rgal3]|uniref:HalOD1 output domain-containing protein n=1 Tax=Natrarchaeobius versutus TaxID=1679078 RepID=UPI003510018B
MIQDVIRTIAGRERTRVENLEPLYESIDTDALARLVTGDRPADRIEFNYAGYRIIIAPDDGWLVLEETH